MTTFTVRIDWLPLEDEGAEAWRAQRCLYAYLIRPGDEIVYIGKSWGTTVRGRWRREAKESFWDDLERERGAFEHGVLVGVVSPPSSSRLTHELLCDTESLLIHQLQPWGNIQSRSTRIARPRMVVRCHGDWPHERRVFRDI